MSPTRLSRTNLTKTETPPNIFKTESSLLLHGESTSKTWDTKNKIIELLGKKKMNLTELSKELDLAPSTVSQHINELLGAGAIQQVYNPFIIKLKYYEINPSFSGIQRVKVEPQRFGPTLAYRILPIVVVAAVLVGVLLAASGALFGRVPPTQATTTAFAAQGPKVPTLFSVSDTPTLSTVDAVNITVSSVMVHSVATGNWITVSNTPETFNLVMLRNISAMLAFANLSAGTYNQLVLRISNESAVVNNRSVSLFIPNSTIRIIGDIVIGANGTLPSSVNIDIDLSKSLHILGNGSVILLPTINLKAYESMNFTTSSNGIITVRSPGVERSEINGSVGVNGSFVSGAPGVPASAGLKIGEGRRIEFEQNATSNTIVIVSHDNAVVITNVTDTSGIEGNFTGWAAGQGLCKDHECSNVSTKLTCELEGGSGTCKTKGSIGITPLPSVSITQGSGNSGASSTEGNAHGVQGANATVSASAGVSGETTGNGASGSVTGSGSGEVTGSAGGIGGGISKAIGHISTSPTSSGTDMTAANMMEWD